MIYSLNAFLSSPWTGSAWLSQRNGEGQLSISHKSRIQAETDRSYFNYSRLAFCRTSDELTSSLNRWPLVIPLANSLEARPLLEVSLAAAYSTLPQASHVDDIDCTGLEQGSTASQRRLHGYVIHSTFTRPNLCPETGQLIHLTLCETHRKG
jgi:hypothetical protein